MIFPRSTKKRLGWKDVVTQSYQNDWTGWMLGSDIVYSLEWHIGKIFKYYTRETSGKVKFQYNNSNRVHRHLWTFKPFIPNCKRGIVENQFKATAWGFNEGSIAILGLKYAWYAVQCDALVFRFYLREDWTSIILAFKDIAHTVHFLSKLIWVWEK